MHYVVMDLEWNQAMSSKSSVFNKLPIHLRGEIIEIGAVKLNEDMISTSGDIVKIGKLNEGGEVGQVDTIFPAGNTAVGHAHDFSQVFLGELALLAELLQESADFLLIHWIHPPYSCMIPQPKQKTPRHSAGTGAKMAGHGASGWEEYNINGGKIEVRREKS